MIPYLGQKSKFSNFIIPNIPKNISIYCEPFGGSFGIFFNLDIEKYPNTKFIYNDINRLNYNLFIQLKNKEFINILEEVKATEEEYYKAKKNLNSSEIKMAINWLILLCCSESKYNIIDGIYKNDSEFEILKLKLKYESHINKIDIISNDDYRDIIKKYDSIESFFYIDPPYKSKEHFYINHNFKEKSHEELSNTLKDIKGKFLLSYYYFPEIDIWYKDFKIIKNKSLMGTEYLIMNY